MIANETLALHPATPDDCPELAAMNRQLIDETGQGNRMTVQELEARMRGWLERGTYTGYIFRLEGDTIGYALADMNEMYVRHFFIRREHRRKGYGRGAVALLFEALGTEEIGLSCLTKNEAGQAFWQSFEHEAYSIKYFIRKPKQGE